jgi:hypothetical protein
MLLSLVHWSTSWTNYLEGVTSSILVPFSIFPHKSSAPPEGQNLTGPDGQQILCWGEKKMDLVFPSHRFVWTFLYVDVQFLIIGVDLLRQNRMLLDPAEAPQMDNLSLESFPIVTEQNNTASPADAPIVALCAAIPPVFKQVLDRSP